MILKGRSRADGDKLAIYLLSPKNDQVRVLGIRGLITDERSPEGLKSALGDMDELGKMTRAKSSLFHLAINPHDQDRMTAKDWKYSVAKAEKALGLEEQPCVVVSHIYQGKEHLHVVWSRVDVEQRKCIEMNFSKRKMVKAAREIEIELGLQQTPEQEQSAPRLKQGVKDIQKHQDARAPQDRAECQKLIRKAWPQSNNGQEFKDQIEEAGYLLAIGKRGVLVIDANHETYSICRYVDGIKTKDVKDKLRDLHGLPTVEEIRQRETIKANEAVRTEDATNPTERKAKDMTAQGVQKELVASNDNTPMSDKAVLPPVPRLPSETDEQYQARLKRTLERIENEKQAPTQEITGPTMTNRMS